MFCFHSLLSSLVSSWSSLSGVIFHAGCFAGWWIHCFFFGWWSICFAPITLDLPHSTSYTGRLPLSFFLTHPLALAALDAARIKKDSCWHRWNSVPRSSSFGQYRPMKFQFGYLIFFKILLIQALAFEVCLTHIALNGCHLFWTWWQANSHFDSGGSQTTARWNGWLGSDFWFPVSSSQLLEALGFACADLFWMMRWWLSSWGSDLAKVFHQC